MNERIKELRMKLNLTQTELGNRIGITRAAISRIESGERKVTEQVFLAICREFNVNEEWLRTGQGEMFIKMDREDEITQWLGSLVSPNNDNEFMKKFIHMLSKLDVEDWKVLEKMALMMAEEKEKS